MRKRQTPSASQFHHKSLKHASLSSQCPRSASKYLSVGSVHLRWRGLVKLTSCDMRQLLIIQLASIPGLHAMFYFEIHSVRSVATFCPFQNSLRGDSGPGPIAPRW